MMNNYDSACGFIIFNNGTNCIRCDAITSFGPINVNDNKSEYYINNICVYKKSNYYKENISYLHKLITDEILNHLKYNIKADLILDSIIDKCLKKYIKKGEANE